MDVEALEREDQERLRAVREKMRAHVEEVLSDYIERAKPVTSAEVRSHLWTVAVADRTLKQLYSQPRRRRPTAQPKTEPNTATKAPAASPETAMLRELQAISNLLDKTSAVSDKAADPAPSEPVGVVTESAAGPQPDPQPEQPAPAPAPEPAPETQADPTPQQQLDVRLKASVDQIDDLTFRCANWAGIWPDGTLFDENDAGWRTHCDSRPLIIDPAGPAADDEAACAELLTGEILRRCNAIARHYGRFCTSYADNTPFREGDPDYFTRSLNYGKGPNRRADGEGPGPPGLPWWVVRRRPEGGPAHRHKTHRHKTHGHKTHTQGTRPRHTGRKK